MREASSRKILQWFSFQNITKVLMIRFLMLRRKRYISEYLYYKKGKPVTYEQELHAKMLSVL